VTHSDYQPSQCLVFVTAALRHTESYRAPPASTPLKEFVPNSIDISPNSFPFLPTFSPSNKPPLHRLSPLALTLATKHQARLSTFALVQASASFTFVRRISLSILFIFSLKTLYTTQRNHFVTKGFSAQNFGHKHHGRARDWSSLWPGTPESGPE
jgi:hypothetical protein